MATALVLAQRVHLGGTLALTHSGDVDAHCVQAAHALREIRGRAVPAWTSLAPASGRRILRDAESCLLAPVYTALRM